MNRSEYIIYFNNKLPLGLRKINEKALIYFEKEQSHEEEYFRDIHLLMGIRDWIQTKSEKEWEKICGEKLEKKKLEKNKTIKIKPYDFSARQVEIIIKSENAVSAVPFGEKLIGKSLNKSYWSYDQLKNTYFTKEILLKDFMDAGDDEKEIIRLMEKYGGSFIDNTNSSNIIKEFIEEHSTIEKILKIIKKSKKFPYVKMTKSHINEIDSPLTRLIQLEIKLLKNVNKKKIPLTKPSKYYTSNIYTYYKYPISLIYDYLWEMIEQKNYRWRRCSYCNNWFDQKKKNVTACCPAHSSMMRKKRLNEKKKETK